MKRFSFLILAIWIGFSLASVAADDGIPITAIQRTDPVDFDREVLPLLRQNCLACHNSTDAEGDVVLESVAKILESESVVPGKPEESLLLVLSAHQDDPVMPPEDNEVKAKNMTSAQLGLIQLWISQGAKPSTSGSANKVQFAKLPPGVNPVYSLSMSRNGNYVVAGRANQIFVYSVPEQRLLDRVTDPQILKSEIYNQPGIAHLDLVQSLAFSPDNETFVSGGFRTVKIWKKQPFPTKDIDLALPAEATNAHQSANRSWLAVASGDKPIAVVDVNDAKVASRVDLQGKSTDAVAIRGDGQQLVIVSEKRKLALVNVASQKSVGKEITLEADITTLTLANDDTLVVAALADKSIAIYQMADFTSASEEAIKPARKLSGHSQPATLFRTFGDQHKMLASAGNDGTARLWDTTSGQAVRSINHGGALSGMDISADGSRVVTCGANGSLKIWNGTNSALINEVRGSSEVEYQIAENDRSVRLKQQLINAAKADLDAGNKEKTAEEANVKKTEEALKKAEEEAQKKMAAKSKAETDLENANKPIMVKKVEAEELTKQQSTLTKKQQKGAEDVKASTAAVAKAEQELKAATEALAAAKSDLDKANKELSAASEDVDLKKTVQKLTPKVADQEKLVAEKTKSKETEATKLANLQAQQKEHAEQLADVTKKLAAVNSEIKKAEPNIKKLTDALKKATDEFTAADRNRTLAKNSVERAKKRSQSAADRVPMLETAHKAATDAKAAQEKSAAEFKSAHEKTLTALNGVRLIGNDTVLYWGNGNEAGLASASTGEKSGTWQSPIPLQQATLAVSGDTLMALDDKNGKSKIIRFTDQWTLAKTIGKIDDRTTFSDRVTALDISADGRMLATGTGEPSRSGEIKIWDLETGKRLQSIDDAHSDTILDIRFSPDGTRIASSSSDRFMKTFDVKSGKLIRVFEGHTHHVMSVDWNSIGRELSTAGADKVVKVWDAESGTQKRTITGYGKEVTSLCFVELTDNIVTASGDKTVRMKRTSNGGEVRQFPGYSDFVYSVATSADGKLFAAGGQDSVVRIWADNGKLVVEFKPPEK